MDVKDGDTIAVWFSCGSASAVATKLTMEKYGARCNVRVVNNFIQEEDADNRRFLADVEKWLGITVENAFYSDFPAGSCDEVWRKRKFMSGVSGAPCTKYLKRWARGEWEDRNSPNWTVMGYTVEEQHRHDKFITEQRNDLLPILIDAGLTKNDCHKILRDVGIELPLMYRLGYPNANCIGCVKASAPTYWNHVRKVHPEVFAERASLSRELGCKLVKHKGKRIFLDELHPDARSKPMNSMKIECSLFC